MLQNTTKSCTIKQQDQYIQKQNKKKIKLKIPANWDQKRVFWNYQYQGNPETW